MARLQVPLLTVLESVTFERVRGRSPLFQSWFDIQPLSLEGDLSLEGLQAAACGNVRPSSVHLTVVLPPSFACIGCILVNCPPRLGAPHAPLLLRPPGECPGCNVWLLLGPLRAFRAAIDACGAQADNRAMAKMDLELWMQEDGTNMFGAVLYSVDIYDRGTAQRAATHILVRPPSLLLRHPV